MLAKYSWITFYVRLKNFMFLKTIRKIRLQTKVYFRENKCNDGEEKREKVKHTMWSKRNFFYVEIGNSRTL